MTNQKENSSDAIQFRPLGIVKEVLDKMNIQISYAYDDLVFVEHNHYLLQFGEVGEELFFYRNTEAGTSEVEKEFQILVGELHGCGITLQSRGEYELKENDDDTISIEFIEKVGAS